MYSLSIRSWAVIAIAAVTLVLADAPFSTDASVYNSGALGVVPNQTFHSSPVVAPIFQVNTFDKGHVDTSKPYLFFDWKYPGHGGAMIFSSKDLSLIYADQSYESTNNVRTQRLGGETYFTFWEGAEELFHGNGRCLFFDKHYNLKYTITPIGLTTGRLTDEHECEATDDGTVVITVYEYITYDFTSKNGPPDGILIDQVIQEINPKTNQLVFQWRASDHFALDDSFAQYPADINPDGFDPFHINSAAKYGNNFLLSSRQMHAIFLVDGNTGAPIWILGGKNNQFEDLTGGNATDFAFQHHARLRGPGNTHLTFFDNHIQAQVVGCRAPGGAADACSRARHLVLSISGSRKTAKLAEEDWFHPAGLASIGRGGHDILPGGNALVAWGTQPAITEHKRGRGDGSGPVMDLQVGILASGFFPGSNSPYRAFKRDWQASPPWDPSLAVVASKAYVSWNGATEVDKWVVMGSRRPSSGFKVVGQSKRMGFETEIEIRGRDEMPRYIRAQAIGKNGSVLGTTAIVDRGT